MAILEIKTSQIPEAKKRLTELREIYPENALIPELREIYPENALIPELIQKLK